jgi:hypothetical protein
MPRPGLYFTSAMGRRKHRREINLLELVPCRMIEYDADENVIVTLQAPRFRSRFMRRYLQPRLKRPYLKVSLDEVGSSIWMLCDGNRKIKDIAEIMRKRFGERIEPCYERLGLFFQQLEHARFICYSNLEECYVERPPETE